jgi:chromosome segregation ATPase
MKALQTQLEREKEKTKTLTAERTELKRQLTSTRKTFARLEKAAAAADKDAEKRREELVAAQQRHSLSSPTVSSMATRLDKLIRERGEIEKAIKSAQGDSERRIAAADARAKAAETKLQSALSENERLGRTDDSLALIAENRRLATELETANADNQKYRKAASDAEETLAKASAEIEKKLKLELENNFETEKNRLNKQIQTLNSQVQSQGKTPLLSAEAASGLVDDFVSKLRGGASGLLMRRGELRLKVAFGSTGEHDGFVVPTAENSDALQGNIHELVVEFDQAEK